MAIDVGRRGFLTGLIASVATVAVAAPAVIRVAPLMKIAVPRTPLYVPIDWLIEDGAIITGSGGRSMFLEAHGWSRPLADNWVNIRDVQPGQLKDWVTRESLSREPEYWLS